MSRPASRTLPRILTIDRAHEPVAEYVAACPWTADGPPPPSALDVYLIHLLVEFAGRPATALDLAARSTSGASTVALLANDRVRAVLVEEGRWPFPPAGERLHEAVRRFVESREPERAAALQVVTGSEDSLDRLAGAAAPRDAAIAILPASEFRGEGAPAASAFLRRFPDGIVVVLGLGRAGADAAVEGLLRTAREEDGLEVRFLRDASPSLFEATAAILARGETAADRSRRIADLFTTNYDFLTILRDSCLYAIERGAKSADKDAAGRIAAESPARYASKADLADATHANRALREENERLAHELQEARSWVRKGNPLLIPVRKAVAFGKRHRRWIAPAGSMRERVARRAIHMGRKLRGA